ncbi:MAG: hypothetical protein IJL03_07430 [Lachnospiraceae bacterium]|nr:hypothetical protein [Lachnospiraceae bacterium]
MHDPYYGEKRTGLSKKAIIAIASGAAIALILCVILAVKLFDKKKPAKQDSGEEAGTGTVTGEADPAASSKPAVKHIVRKYNIYGWERTLKEQEELDEKGFLVKRTTYRAGKESAVFEYLNNPAGLPVWGTCKSGDTTGKINIIYDAQDRVISREWINYQLKEGTLSTGKQQIVYDGAGNVTLDETKSMDTNTLYGETVNTHMKTARQFDDSGRILYYCDQSITDDTITESHEITYTYYDNGNPKTTVEKTTDPETADTRIETYYKEDGGKYKVLTFLGDVLSYQTEYDGDREVTVMYSALGEPPIVITDKTVQEAYDFEERIISRLETNSDHSAVEETYTYFEDGRLMRMKRDLLTAPHDGKPAHIQSSAVTEYVYSGPNGECSIEVCDRKITIYENGETYSYSRREKYAEYEYDTFGNMTRKYIYTPENTDGIEYEISEWKYDAKNRLVYEMISVNNNVDHEYEWEYFDE